VAHERQSLLDTNAEEGETTLHVCMAGRMFSTASGTSLTSQRHAYWAVLNQLGQLRLQLRKVYFSDFSIPTRQQTNNHAIIDTTLKERRKERKKRNEQTLQEPQRLGKKYTKLQQLRKIYTHTLSLSGSVK